MYLDWNNEKQKLVATTWHPKEVYLAEDSDGEVDTLHRRFKLTAKNAYAEYGDQLSKEIIENAQKTPYTEHEFLMAIYPNTDRAFGKTDNQNMPYITKHKRNYWLKLHYLFLFRYLVFS